jgi:hypothetical protein
MPLAPAVDRAIGKIMTAGVSALRHLKWWLGEHRKFYVARSIPAPF